MDVRRIIMFGVVMLLLSVLGCNSSDHAQQATEAAAPKTPPPSDKVAILFHRDGSAFEDAIHDGLARAAADFDVDVEFMVGDSNDPDQQLTLLNEAVEKRCRGICIAPLDATAIVEPLVAAKEAGIPVVTFQRTLSDEVTRVSHAATDQFHAGRSMAEFLAERIADDATVLLVDCPSQPQSLTRRNGFVFAAEKELQKFTIVVMDCQDDTVAAIQESTKQHDGLAAIVAFNVPSSIAALEALSSGESPEILVCGYGAWDGVQTAIENGTLAATLLEDPYLIGYSAVMAMAHHLAGEKELGEYITTGEHVVSKDELEQPTTRRLVESNMCSGE